MDPTSGNPDRHRGSIALTLSAVSFGGLLGGLRIDRWAGYREAPGMDVRPLREEETGEVIAIWHDSRKETHTAMGIETERGVTLAESARIFREHIASRCEIWVAQQGGRLLGFLALRGSYIDRMYVRPGAQRRGVGAALLEKARELSPAGLELHTHQVNHGARNFYEKHGFRPIRFGVSPPPESEPDVEYRWRRN